MKSNTQTPLLGIVSPYGLAIFSYAVFLFSCLIPPSIYSSYMNEPDLMFLDARTVLVYTLGVLSFILGVWLVSWLFPSTFTNTKLRTRVSPFLFLLVPLISATGVLIFATAYLIKQYPAMVLYLLTQQGGAVKDAMIYDSTGHYGLAPHALTAITWWSFWRYPQIGVRGWRKRLLVFFIVLASLVIIFSSVLTVNRSVAMIFICGLTILFFARRLGNKEVSGAFLLRSALTIAIGFPALFMGFTFLRGTSNLDSLVNSFIGYTIASYNRMAAMLNGNLHFPFAGHGLGLGGAIVTSRVLPFGRYLDMPDPGNLFASSFDAVTQAGLEGRLVWEGAFADIFGDIGWFYLPFVFGYGALYGLVWSWFKRGKLVGVVLYPWLGFCILFWIGGNYLFGGPIEALIPLTIMLVCYEFLLVSPSQ